MSEILLIRHGQASFGADNYDVLSGLGERQSVWLGEHLAARGVRPGRVIAGTLARQRATAEGVLRGMGAAAEIETHPGLDEYDADAVLAAYLEAKPEAREALAPGDRRAHFRALADALVLWQSGEIDGAESFAEFEARTADAMRTAADGERADGEGPALVVTSGGVIGQMLRAALEAPPASMIRLHMQVRNAGYSRLFAGRGGMWVASFNETPHLEARDGAVTYS